MYPGIRREEKGGGEAHQWAKRRGQNALATKLLSN